MYKVRVTGVRFVKISILWYLLSRRSMKKFDLPFGDRRFLQCKKVKKNNIKIIILNVNKTDPGKRTSDTRWVTGVRRGRRRRVLSRKWYNSSVCVVHLLVRDAPPPPPVARCLPRRPPHVVPEYYGLCAHTHNIIDNVSNIIQITRFWKHFFSWNFNR